MLPKNVASWRIVRTRILTHILVSDFVSSMHVRIPRKARAIECQCYVIAAAQYGANNAKRTSYGHSLVVDPWGKVLVDAGGMDSEGPLSSTTVPSTPSIVTAEIDLEYLNSVRQRLPIQQHRQTAQYD